MPPKVCVFWWRVLNGFLPARQILNKRHIDPIANCEVCGAEKETILRVLVECTIAKQFWEHARVLTGVKLPRLHHITWATDLLDPSLCPEKDASVILCGMWTLWMVRNDRRHGRAPFTLRHSILWARDTAFDLWQMIKMNKANKAQGLPKVVHRWEKPDEGWVKCNSDAAFFEELHAGTSGVVLRNHEGRCLIARARWKENCLDSGGYGGN